MFNGEFSSLSISSSLVEHEASPSSHTHVLLLSQWATVCAYFLCSEKAQPKLKILTLAPAQSQMRMLSSYLFPHTDSKRPHKRKHDSQRMTQPTSTQCAERAAYRFYLANEERKREKSPMLWGNYKWKTDPWRDSFEQLQEEIFWKRRVFPNIQNTPSDQFISSQSLNKNKSFTEMTHKKRFLANLK